MEILTYLPTYLIIGVAFNLIYDLGISHIKREDLRFNNAERIVFTLIWPLYLSLLIFNHIKKILNDRNKDN